MTSAVKLRRHLTRIVEKYHTDFEFVDKGNRPKVVLHHATGAVSFPYPRKVSNSRSFKNWERDLRAHAATLNERPAAH